MCISWTIKGLISLMHGVTKNIIWGLYRMLQFFPQAASANTALRQSTGIVVLFYLRLLVRLMDWAQTSRTKNAPKALPLVLNRICAQFRLSVSS